MNGRYFKSIFIITLFLLATLPLFYFIHLSGSEVKKPRQNFDNVKSLLYATVVDFEDPEVRYGQYGITNEKAYSGEYSCKFDTTSQFGYGFTLLANRIGDFAEIRTIGFEAVILSYDTLQNVSQVISIEDMNNHSVFWYSSNVDSATYNWEPTEAVFKIPSGIIKRDYHIKLYFWNRNKQRFFADDYKIWLSSDSVPSFTKKIYFEQ